MCSQHDTLIIVQSIWIPYRTVKMRGLVKTLDWKSQGFPVSLELILCESVLKKTKINTADKIQISGFLFSSKNSLSRQSQENCRSCQSQDIMVKFKLRNIFSLGLIFWFKWFWSLYELRYSRMDQIKFVEDSL